ncbi:MAG: CocE/NonD family hydrolase [Chloroflexota bacterium]
MSAPPRPPTKRHRWRRTLTLAAVAVALTFVAVPSALGFLTTYRLLYAPCGEDPRTPADFGHPWEDVTIAGREGRFRAYFIPGANGAVVIIPPAAASGRGNRLHEADVLARHGYAVLAFESRRCAGMGPLSLGYREIAEIGDALAYLEARGDVNPARIGVLGFSSAGATAVMAAARYPALRAVVAEGGYGDFAEGTLALGTGGPLEVLYKEAIALSYRLLSGVELAKLSPQSVIGSIAPRPVLLIYGSRERSLGGARAQLAAAGANAALWVVDGAGHGDYLAVAPQEYEERVMAFFDAALLGLVTTTER